MRAIKLIPKNNALFINGNDNVLHFTSCTLFSALVNCYSLLYLKTTDSFINEFADNSKMVSSVFYGVDSVSKEQKTKSTYFLPKPLCLLKSSSYDDGGSKKKIKKITYISLEIYKELLGSWDSINKYFNYDLSKHSVLGGRFCYYAQKDIPADENNSSFLDIVVEPKMPHVNRFEGQGEDNYAKISFQSAIRLHSFKANEYEGRPFMFFFYKGELDKKFKAVLNLLCEEGLGGDRSTGKGSFVSWEEKDLEVSETGTNGGIALSLVYPDKEEVNKLLAYGFTSRDGYMYSPFGVKTIKKNRLRMLSEGTVFSGTMSGKMVKIPVAVPAEHHPVYENGICMSMRF